MQCAIISSCRHCLIVTGTAKVDAPLGDGSQSTGATPHAEDGKPLTDRPARSAGRLTAVRRQKRASSRTPRPHAQEGAPPVVLPGISHIGGSAQEAHGSRDASKPSSGRLTGVAANPGSATTMPEHTQQVDGNSAGKQGKIQAGKLVESKEGQVLSTGQLSHSKQLPAVAVSTRLMALVILDFNALSFPNRTLLLGGGQHPSQAAFMYLCLAAVYFHSELYMRLLCCLGRGRLRLVLCAIENKIAVLWHACYLARHMHSVSEGYQPAGTQPPAMPSPRLISRVTCRPIRASPLHSRIAELARRPSCLLPQVVKSRSAKASTATRPTRIQKRVTE